MIKCALAEVIWNRYALLAVYLFFYCVVRCCLNKAIKELDGEKKVLSDKIEELENKSDNPINFKVLNNTISKWDNLSFDEKRDVVELLIEKIVVYSDKIEIVWKV